MLRTGAEYLKALKDGRQVYLGGELVTDVTEHRGFKNAARSVADLYDVTSNPQNQSRLTYREPETGKICNANFLRPKSADDLRLRRNVHEAWADVTWGLIGRAPDHVAAFITGMACLPEVADAHNQGFGKNITNYWRYIRDNDLFVAYAVVPPAGAKGTEAVAIPQQKTAGKTEWGENAGLRVVKEDSSGITVWGFKILATGAVLSDEVLIGNVLPLSPGQESYAITFALPMAAPGMKILSRRSYEQMAVSEIDDPLASRFDETDAVIFCDNVLVPWDRVFAHNYIDTARAIFYDTPAHTLGNAQAHVRLLSKMRLMLGIIEKVAKANGIASIPAVRDKLYALAVRVAVVEGLINGQHADVESWAGGFVTQRRQTMYATMSWSMEYYPEFVRGIRELLGSHPFQQPADASVFRNPDTAEIFSKFYLANPTESVERYKLMKLAWDLVGTEFANRHTQYEMFYAGPTLVTRGRLGYYFDWKRVVREADRCRAPCTVFDAFVIPP
ncbi:MAG: 4-hydroxyphenylacetate 3-hydroxylase family protein [Alphaproteobacteria bacterium]